MLTIKLKKQTLATMIGGILCASQAQATDFYFGDDDSVLLQINSQLSFGASWRLKEADPRYIDVVNGGTGLSTTTDDGTQNFGQGETFSKIIKGYNDFQLSKDNFGAFVRVKYWYDQELKDENRPHGNSTNGYTPGIPLSDEGFANLSKFSGIEIMDAYVYGGFDLGGMPLDVRAGRQVLSWGESTFIQGGLNSTNPFDVNALRRPGADLKEGLIPVGMMFANLGLTENLSVEAFYQYEWQATLVDGCGTLFQGADFAAQGCDYVTVKMADQTALALGIAAKREADIEPDDGGQYGIAFRYLAPELNDTEFGFYYMNIHSRVPMIDAIRSDLHQFTNSNPDIPVPNLIDVTGPFLPWGVAVSTPALAPLLGFYGIDTSRESIDALNPGYALEFPEDLKFYGLSFATNVSGLALSGEISYKPDTPIQINGNHVLAAALAEAPIPFTDRLVAGGSGATVRGWDTFDVTQLQVTALQFYDRVLGASRLTIIAEAGMVMTNGIEDKGKEQGYYYGRNPVFGLNIPSLESYLTNKGLDAAVAAGTAAAINTGAGNDGFVTDVAWGYRARAVLEYSDVFAGVSLRPTIDWKHDVSGYSPEPGQQFAEGTKSFGLSLEASYQQQYTATVSVKSFSGGDYNVLTDKDFVSLSFGFSY